MSELLKYVITGHRSGIGKALFMHYASKPNVYCVGYDISHYLDLNDPKTHSHFIKDCEDASVIVLNAPSGEQHESLKTIHSLFKNEPKHVIAVGSMVSKIWKTLEEVPERFQTYWFQKKLLDDTVEDYVHLNYPIKISIIRPWWVDTPLAKEYTGKKLTIDTVVDTIKYIIENKNNHITNIDIKCVN